MISRRGFLKFSAGASVASLALSCEKKVLWQPDAYRKPEKSLVAVLTAKDYGTGLHETLMQGIKQFKLDISGKRILLKPNLVEFDPKGVINTHPAMVAAAVEAFGQLGAREIIVGEGPGHRRDNEYLLRASGLWEVVRDKRVRYVDLNTDDVRPLKLRSRYTRFETLYLPETLFKADLLVSLPKLKTHHWAGVTLSMKNLFGIIPGAVYGWPKNALHWAGMNQSIVDINSSLPLPHFAIVDGIVGMEGNGPLQGEAKASGVIVFGSDFVSVDASAARLMTIEPCKVKYLNLAGDFLGNLELDHIEQIGEPLERHMQDFKVIEKYQDLKKLVG